MRIGVNLGPTGDWAAMVAATRAAEKLGYDSVGFLDHYHSVFVWDWPENIAEKLVLWEQLGAERTFLTFWHPFDQLEQACLFMH